MFVIKYRKFFLGLSAVLVLVSVGLIAFFGLNLGIEFTGGSMLEVSYGQEQRPNFETVQSAIESDLPGLSFTLQETGADGYIIRTEHLDEESRPALLSALSFEEYEATEERFSSIGPSIGAELRNRALMAIVGVIIAIILYIAYVFRQVSQPVSSWKYGSTAVVALIHDILLPVGLFALLGAVLGAEIDILFVTALLAILGFSVNDTIVVFDRVRENLRLNEDRNAKEPFAETVGRSLQQTYTRSINTSLTTLLVLTALYFLGGSVTQFFALVLIVGVLAGTYSSIFLASPLLVEIEKRQKPATVKKT